MQLHGPGWKRLASAASPTPVRPRRCAFSLPTPAPAATRAPLTARGTESELPALRPVPSLNCLEPGRQWYGFIPRCQGQLTRAGNGRVWHPWKGPSAKLTRKSQQGLGGLALSTPRTWTLGALTHQRRAVHVTTRNQKLPDVGSKSISILKNLDSEITLQLKEPRGKIDAGHHATMPA